MVSSAKAGSGRAQPQTLRARARERAAKHAVELDATDLRMLELLQRNGRLSNARLADELGIAPSTAHARLASLLERGVITGVHAEVDPRSIGLAIEALISVSIRSGARQNIPGFLAGMRERPEVVEAFFLGGVEDFVLHVAVPDSDALRDFVVEHLSSDAAVAGTRTSLIFERHRRAPSPA